MIIELLHKQIYGRHCFYPVSKDAKFLCKIIGKPTLTIDHILICQQAGWNVKGQSEKTIFSEIMKKLMKKKETLKDTN